MAIPRVSGYFPSRPMLGAVLLCALAFWMGCALTYGSGAALAGQRCFANALAFGLAALACIPLAALRKMRMAGLALLACALGCMLGWASAAALHSAAAEAVNLPAEVRSFELVEDSRKSGFYETARASCDIGGGRTCVVQAKFKGADGVLYQGDRIEALSTFEAIDFSEDDYSWREGACAQATLSSIRALDATSPIEPLRNVRIQAIEAIGAEDESHAILQALVCGYRRNLSGTQTYESFKACGLAHLVAVSGAHLVIVTSLFVAALRALGVPRRISVGVLVCVMASYLVLSGFPISAVRATFMSSVGVLALFAKRRPSSANALGLGLFAIVGAHPSAALSVSLALSALSTLGIVIFAPLFVFWLERTPLARAHFVIEALSLTLSSSLLSMPYSAALFSVLPFVSPLANVVCAPLFPVACGLGLISGVLSAVAFPGCGAVVACASWISSLLAGVVGVLADIPYAAVPAALDATFALGLSALASAALWAWWPKPSKRVGCAAIIGAALFLGLTIAQVSFEEGIVMLDVGQGDALLVRSQGKTLLVDTGNQDLALIRELGRNRIVRLDAVLITHADDDHYGSLDALCRYVQVGQVIVAADMTTCDADKPREIRQWVQRLGSGLVGVELRDAFSIGRFKAEVVWPEAFSDQGGNADSLCVSLAYDANGDGAADVRALMTGDAESAQIEEMLQRGLIGRIDVLKVGHHGSRSGTTAEQMRALHPKVALISCGANNRYGHPTEEILEQLEAVGCEVYRSDLDGEVRCMLGEGRVSVGKLG